MNAQAELCMIAGEIAWMLALAGVLAIAHVGVWIVRAIADHRWDRRASQERKRSGLRSSLDA